MSFLTVEQENLIKEKLVNDETLLKQIYRAKKKTFYELSVKPSEVNNYEKDGWEIQTPLKTKIKIKKDKKHSEIFEDNIWCQFYELGYRYLNRDENFILPFGKDIKDKKQIDIIAINDDTIFLIECKSSEKSKKAPSYKDEFDLLKLRLDGFKKSLSQIFGREIKIKYIFATRNIRLSVESDDMQRLLRSNAFYYNDNTYDYINNLIKNYKNAAHYQFLGLIFKNEKINNLKIEISALEGKMGNKTYYMFSIEPSLLLKMGFILHRTKANENEMPTYQRLLVPSRLKGITKFIDDGGYFPNSLIINFHTNKKIQFEPLSREKTTNSRMGILKIPNEYAIAYIIDGQHRLYGYANSNFRDTNTIPVVAMNGLESVEQLSIFMDINQNQKAVSPSLRLVLEEDLYWDSERADSRLKALRSSVIKQLSISTGPLYNKISIGEDAATLSFDPFAKAILKSGLLPRVKGNQYDDSTTLASLYNVNNTNHPQEMMKAKKNLVSLLNMCYELVEEEFPAIFDNDKFFIVSNRGTFPFIMIIGSLNTFLVEQKILNSKSTSKDRYKNIEKYLRALLTGLEKLSDEEAEKYLIIRGAGAETTWLRFFQSIINTSFPEYEPSDLIDWQERQNEELQNEGRIYGEQIEKYMKKTILNNLQELYNDKWELEIASIVRECQNRASLEDEKNYKEGIDKEKTDWTEMFNINDYKAIIEKHWSKKPNNNETFVSFENIFSIDMGFGFNSKSEKIKWISHFNSYRNLWAHAGTKEKRLNKVEVEFLKKIYTHLLS